jgi:hypothetical protein
MPVIEAPVIEAPATSAPSRVRPAGPPKLRQAELRTAQQQTLAQPRLRYDPVTRLLVATVNLVYGRRASLAKFKVLEVLAPLPYQAWERVAYRAFTRFHRHGAVARRVLDAIAEARAQQDNEAWHLLIMENLLAAQRFKQGVIRFRLLPRLMAGPYRLLCWTLLVIRPAWSYRLNASFEDHAEHEYMTFAASHPELGTRDYDREALVGYGNYESVADLLRQVGHDERVHKLESLAALRQPRIR